MAVATVGASSVDSPSSAAAAAAYMLGYHGAVPAGLMDVSGLQHSTGSGGMQLLYPSSPGAAASLHQHPQHIPHHAVSHQHLLDEQTSPSIEEEMKYMHDAYQIQQRIQHYHHLQQQQGGTVTNGWPPAPYITTSSTAPTPNGCWSKPDQQPQLSPVDGDHDPSAASTSISARSC